MQKSEFVAKTKKNGKEYMETNLLDCLQLGFPSKENFCEKCEISHFFTRMHFENWCENDAELKFFFSRNMRNSSFFSTNGIQV